MYGVVLWSDLNDQKAVIWCEDHGDLAFYSGQCDNAHEGLSLDAGDLVQFQISEGRDMRLARNPTLVAEQQYPTLARELKGSEADNIQPEAQPKAQPKTMGNVLPFLANFATPRMTGLA